MPEKIIRISEPRSGLDVKARLLDAKAPANARFLWDYLSENRVVPALHAMWTGPEISCPVPSGHLSPAVASNPLPAENATLNPLAGDIVLAYVPAFMWGGNPDPIFDIGLFYGHGARMLFPIGWFAGSVVGQVLAEDREELARACNVIRKNGACEITFRREED